MTELMTAAEAKDVASNAIANNEKEAVAKAIENAANKGKYSVVVSVLSDDLTSELQELGYIVAARMNFTQLLGYNVSWDDSSDDSSSDGGDGDTGSGGDAGDDNPQ